VRLFLSYHSKETVIIVRLFTMMEIFNFFAPLILFHLLLFDVVSPSPISGFFPLPNNKTVHWYLLPFLRQISIYTPHILWLACFCPLLFSAEFVFFSTTFDVCTVQYVRPPCTLSSRTPTPSQAKQSIYPHLISYFVLYSQIAACMQ